MTKHVTSRTPANHKTILGWRNLFSRIPAIFNYFGGKIRSKEFGKKSVAIVQRLALDNTWFAKAHGERTQKTETTGSATTKNVALQKPIVTQRTTETMKILKGIIIGGALVALGSALQAADSGGKWRVNFDVGVAIPQDFKLKDAGSVTLSGADLTSANVYDALDETPLGADDTLSQLGITNIDIQIIGHTTSATNTSMTLAKGKSTIKLDPGIRFDLGLAYEVAESFTIGIESGLLYNGIKDLKYTLSASGDQSSPGSRSFKIDLDGSLYQIPVLANAVYTFKLDSKVKPFIGGGVGGVATIIDIKDSSESDFVFAYQGTAGLLYEIHENVDLGVSYKFLGTMDHKFGSIKTEEILSHSILACLNWRF